MDSAARFFGDCSKCRHAALRAYFGEQKLPKECQACDVCCARQLGLTRYGRPPTRDALSEAQKLVHLACVLHGHGVTSAKLRNITLVRKLPTTCVSSRLLATDAEAQPHMGGLDVLRTNRSR